MYQYKPGSSWYVQRQTWFILVHTSMYAKKAKWHLCMTSGFEPRTSSIACCILIHYATSVNPLVPDMDKSYQLYTKQDIYDTRYLLAGVGRLARVPRRPPLRPWRHWSAHQLVYTRYIHAQTWFMSSLSWVQTCLVPGSSRYILCYGMILL